jgi:hypothetical protein
VMDQQSSPVSVGVNAQAPTHTFLSVERLDNLYFGIPQFNPGIPPPGDQTSRVHTPQEMY